MIEKRFATFERSAETENEELMTVSFSSEQAVLRSWGWEILSHRDDDADLEYLNSGNAPLLLDHETNDHCDQIGCVVSAEVVEGRGIARVKFSKDESKRGIISDIREFIRPNTSVGYRVLEKQEIGTYEGIKVYRCKWQPYEISSVAIGADSSTGFNRTIDLTTLDNLTKENIMSDEIQKPVEEVRSAPIQDSKPVAANAADVIDFCRKMNVDHMTSDLVRSGKTMIEVREAVITEVEKRVSQQQVEFKPQAPAIISSEKRSFDNDKAVRAAILGNWDKAGFEREMCEERVLQSNGLVRFDKNIVILNTQDSVRAFTTAGTAGTGAELVGTNYMPEKIVDLLWNKTYLSKIGCDTMTGLRGNASFPIINNAPTNNWIAETAALPAAQALGTALKTISPRQLVAKYEFSRQAVIQDVPNVQGMITNQIYNAIAQALDVAVMSGASVPLSTTGLINEITQTFALGVNGSTLSTAVSSATVAQAMPTFVALRKLLVTAKVDVSKCKWLMPSILAEHLGSTLKEFGNSNSGYMLTEGQKTIGGLPYVDSQNVPSNLTKGTSSDCSALILGDFSDLLVASWDSIQLEFDNVTRADNSIVVARAFSFWDAVVKRAASFAMCKDIRTL